ncbi:hypothetical protein L484_006741 [Morus notabilis]|uniref:FAD-binding domain-containing protein n=1 Tax=Morus notabilis TaxID=981085 RepID=W9RKK6_9ROSA|nr:hypothetical protein L484_006741 [Morus notabilis]
MGIFRCFKRFHGRHMESSRITVFSPGYIQRRFLSSSKFINNGDTSVLPVLIVGAGPVGLVLSILLAKLGLTETFKQICVESKATLQSQIIKSTRRGSYGDGCDGLNLVGKERGLGGGRPSQSHDGRPCQTHELDLVMF